MKKLTLILTAIFLIAICFNTLSCSNSAGGGSSESGQNTSVNNSGGTNGGAQTPTGNTGNTGGGTTTTPTIETKTGSATITLSDGKKVTVTYNDCGNATNPINYTVNENTVTVTFGTATAKTGHTFDGWYDNASCSGTALTEAALAEKIAAGQDINIYAKWTEIAVTSITLNKTALELEFDNTETLTATVTPSDAFNKTITWTSNNANVATVENGVVTTKGEGNATITATAASGVSATCAVTVTVPSNAVVITLEKMKKANNGKATTVLSQAIFRKICPDYANVETVIIDEGITTIGRGSDGGWPYSVFNGDCKKLKTVKLPTTITTIEIQAFYPCRSLKNINLPEGLTKLGADALRGTSIESITVPSTITVIEESVFLSCLSLKSVTLRPGITKISGGAFQQCRSLKTINIPSGVKEIDGLSECDALESIRIPASVIKISAGCFSSSPLKYVIFESETPPELGYRPFYGSDAWLKEFKIYVPAGSVEAYKDATGWKNYKDKIYPIE